MGTGYYIHIPYSHSVKGGRRRLSHAPAFREYEIRHDRRTQAPLVLSAQLR